MILYKVYLGLCLVSFTNFAHTEIRPDIPFDETDTYRISTITGHLIINPENDFTKQHRDWWEVRKNPIRTCEEGNLFTKEPVEVIESLFEILKHVGRKSCQCMPMGESCLPGTCTCEEICPNHHGILRGRADYMRPTLENDFPFLNNESFNDSAFERYPINEGFCSGFNYVHTKFQVLADFHPDLKSRPKMKKGSPIWRNYILGQIERYGQDQKVEFYGIAELQELARDTEFREALKTKGGWSFTDDEIENKEFWDLVASPSERLKFSEPTGTDFEEQIAIDPDSGKPIPPQGTLEYKEFIAEKVKKISQGEPTSLPGYSSINSISSDPTYMEIIGAQIAIDWKTGNYVFDKYDPHNLTIYDPDDEDLHLKPMTTDQLKSFITQTKAYLPRLPQGYPYSVGEGESWNPKGPFQVLPITISSKKEMGDKSEIGLHSINAWAYQNLPKGGILVCIDDPNYPSDKTGRCYPSITIPNPDDPSTVEYDGAKTVLKFNYDTTGFSRIGLLTRKLVEYCRRTKAFRFKGGKKCAE